MPFTRRPILRNAVSEVKATTLLVTGTETTRATVITPASGRKFRIISVQAYGHIAGDNTVEVYFGTGTNIDTAAAKAIARGAVALSTTGDTATGFFASWGDGAGPIGAVDEVLSFRAKELLDYSATVVYREES